MTVVQPEETAYGQGQSVVYYGAQDGRLEAVSVFLADRWVDAHVSTTYPTAAEQSVPPPTITVRIQLGQETLSVEHRVTNP
ncbi:MAG: hypothetical protein ABI874_03280 [Chloroflexota bacterium]